MPDAVPQSPAPSAPAAPTQPAQSAPHPAPQPVAPPEPKPELKPDPKLAEAPPAPPLSDNKQHFERLDKAINDAHTLLDFAARHAITIEHDTAASIIASHDKVSRSDDLSAALTAEEQAKFWTAFCAIIKRVEPVTVESIHFSKESKVDTQHLSWFKKLFSHKTPADRILRRYLSIAVFSLLALLSLQVEWAIGMAIYNDAYKVHGYLLSTTSELIQAAQISNSFKDTDTVAASQALMKQQELERRHAQDGSWDDVSYVRLWWWNRQIAALIPPYDLNLNERGPRTEAGTVKLDNEGQRRIEFTRAQLTLEVIANYILVALFALLGSMTQALRSLSAEIDAVSLTANRLYTIRTRIILGVISGVCMAWLVIISSQDAAVGITAEPVSPLASISFLGAFTPWALAFISGYSVEIFFAALERIISAITRRIEMRPEDQQAQQHRTDTSSAQPIKTPPQQTQT